MLCWGTLGFNLKRTASVNTDWTLGSCVVAKKETYQRGKWPYFRKSNSDLDGIRRVSCVLVVDKEVGDGEGDGLWLLRKMAHLSLVGGHPT